jgi:hypothetical protein
MQRIHGLRHIESALRPQSNNYLGYGLGTEIGEYRGRRAAGHGGMDQTYNCFLKLFPDDRAGVVLLTNQCDEDLLWDLVTSLYDRVLDLPHPGDVAHGAPTALAAPPGSERLQQVAGTYVRFETAERATFAVLDGQLVLEHGGQALPLVPVGSDRFYAQVTETRRLPVAFVHNADGKTAHVMLGGEPYHAMELDPTFRPDPQRWRSYEGLYKDPSNSNQDEMLAVRLQDGTLFVAEGTHEALCTAIGDGCFLSELGLIEFEDTHADGAVVLVWGKATRYYPVDARLCDERGVIRYRVDTPSAPQRPDGPP